METPSANSSPLSYVECTEQKRLNEARDARIPWKKWGPYLSERQWGTVREDYSDDPHWKDHILFYEYFHGDNGAGLGASHQTGWTGVVARTLDLFARMTPTDVLQVFKDELTSRMTREQVAGQ